MCIASGGSYFEELQKEQITKTLIFNLFHICIGYIVEFHLFIYFTFLAQNPVINRAIEVTIQTYIT